MADERSSSSPEQLRLVLEKLNDVLAEAARLRAEVMRQLTDQRASAQQHLTPQHRRTARAKR